jgi:hypothetical protein
LLLNQFLTDLTVKKFSKKKLGSHPKPLKAIRSHWKPSKAIRSHPKMLWSKSFSKKNCHLKGKFFLFTKLLGSQFLTDFTIKKFEQNLTTLKNPGQP